MAEAGSVERTGAILLLVVCGVRLCSDAIAAMPAGEADIDPVETAGAEDELVAGLTSTGPDLARLDTGAPGALAMVARLVRGRPMTPILHRADRHDRKLRGELAHICRAQSLPASPGARE